MLKRISQEKIYLWYSGVSALLFIMMKTVREIYRVDVANLDAFQLVLMGTTLEITHFLFEVPTGIVADKYSRKISIIIGLFLISASFFMEGLFPFFWVLIFTQIILGIGDTFTSGADEAWIADEMGNENLAPLFLKATQVGQYFAIIGTILSIIFGLFLIRLPYLIGGALFIVLAISLIFLMKETNFHKTKSTDKALIHIKKTINKVYHLIKMSSVLKFMFLVTLFHGLFSEGFDRLWTAHFLKDFNIPKFNVSFLSKLNEEVLFIGPISLGSMIISILAVQYIKKRLQKTGKLEKVWILFYINLLMVLTLFGFAITGNLIVAASLYIVFYTVRRINRPVYRAWMNEYIPSNIRATVLSSYGQLDSIGQIIGGPIIGFIALKVSIPMGILSAVVLLLPVVIIYLIFIHKIKNNKIKY